MDDFITNNTTNYWIYALPDIMWAEYSSYLDASDPMYISSFKYFDVPIGDIAIVYKKGEKSWICMYCKNKRNMYR